MGALLNPSSFVRRLAVLAFVFITLVYLLQGHSSWVTDYFGNSSNIGQEYETNSPLTTPTEPIVLDDESSLPSPFPPRPEVAGDLFDEPVDVFAPVDPVPSPAEAESETEATQQLEPVDPPAPEAIPVNEVPKSTPRSRLSQAFQKYLQWDPPVEIKSHYPPYDAYKNRDYDPNRWEQFEQNQLYYTNGTTDHLEKTDQQPTTYEVYPAYNSAEWLKTWQGEYVSCEGAFGVNVNNSEKLHVKAYEGVPKGFPYPHVGSWEAVGLDDNVCFDREARLGPYGLGNTEINWSQVKWGQLQEQCTLANKHRYRDSAAPVLAPGAKKPTSAQIDTDGDTTTELQARQLSAASSKKTTPRTAVLIRTWDSYVYEDNDFQAIRSLISELSLQSGGEYHVFLFVNIKNIDRRIFTDPAAYQEALEKFVPEELRDIAILWTERVCMEWYPKVGEWSVYFQQFMPLQWFSETHPEFDYVWNWEMDARYIGHHYHFLEQLGQFAKQQPRKYLWERNSRYYLPAEHGNYANFTTETNRIIEESPNVESVWGPQPWSENQSPTGPEPPTSEAADDFDWGVGEEADLITLLPLWDPRTTWWSYRDKLWGYPASKSGPEDRPYQHVPRRVFINTLVRFSAKLLHTMHIENEAGQSMASEMLPGTIALQHGLKAVYAPHPIWISHFWPSEYMDLVFNADGWGAGSVPGTNIDHGHGVGFSEEIALRGFPQNGTGPNREGYAGRWSQERDAPYSPDREHNFAGWSWYFWSDFPKTLYWRWLGWRSSFSIVTIEGSQSTDGLGQVEWGEWEKDHGRMCLPGMLLHPVKNVKPPQPPADSKTQAF